MSLVWRVITGEYDVRTFGFGRSSRWSAVRGKHLAANPRCAACGRLDSLEVHHIRPVHRAPELELEPTNLITLCEGPTNCHFTLGHLGNWSLANPQIVQWCEIYRAAKRAAQHG